MLIKEPNTNFKGSPMGDEHNKGDLPNNLEHLFKDANEFVETKVNLWRLKTVDTLADSVATLASGLGLFSIVAGFILMVSIGLSLLIGDWLEKSYYGFFIVGGLYALAGFICYKFRNRWMKEPVGDLLVRILLKHKK